jgi:hypothetical protein
MTVSKMCPTDNPKAHLEAVYHVTEKLTEKSNAKSTSQVLLTSQKPTGMEPTESTEKSTGEVYSVYLDSIEASLEKHNHEVSRMVTEADFQRLLSTQPASGGQCHIPMTTA